MSERMERLLRELISVPSTAGREREAAEKLHRFLAANGISSELEAFGDGRFNCCAWHITHPDRPLLVLCSHLDVVPAGERKEWDTDPWEMAETGDGWRGRGTCDAKGQVAAMSEAFLNLAADADFAGNLCLAAMSGEETGLLGARHFVPQLVRRWKSAAISCLIGEPTNGLPCIEHTGRIEFTVTVEGVAKHAALAAPGQNAGLNAVKLLNCLLPQLEEAGVETELGCKATLALTRIDAFSGANNIVPGRCTLIWDRRFVYLENAEEICRRFEGAVLRSAETAGVRAAVSSRIGLPASYTPPSDPVAQAALEGCGGTNRFRSFGAACDMAVFHGAGIPCVILGAGDLHDNRAHGANEFILRAQLEEIARIYEKTARSFFERVC